MLLRALLLCLLLPLAACAGGASEDHPAATVAADDSLTVDTSRSKPEVARYVKLGQEAAQREKPDVAAMMYRAAHQADPADPAPKLAMAQLLAAGGDPAQAAQAYDTLARDQSLPTDARLALGYSAARTQLQQQDYTGAATRYEQLAAQDRSAGRWRAYNGLGVARSLMTQDASARAAYQEALRLLPDGNAGSEASQVRSNLALSEIIGGDYQAAITLLAPAVERGRATADETRLLALAYGFAGRIDEARQLGLDAPPSPEMLRQLKTVVPGGAVAPAAAAAPEIPVEHDNASAPDADLDVDPDATDQP